MHARYSARDTLSLSLSLRFFSRRERDKEERYDDVAPSERTCASLNHHRILTNTRQYLCRGMPRPWQERRTLSLSFFLFSKTSSSRKATLCRRNARSVSRFAPFLSFSLSSSSNVRVGQCRAFHPPSSSPRLNFSAGSQNVSR